MTHFWVHVSLITAATVRNTITADHFIAAVHEEPSLTSSLNFTRMPQSSVFSKKKKKKKEKLRRKLAYLQLDSKMVTSRLVSERGKLRASQLRVKHTKRVSIKRERARDSLCFQRCHPFKPKRCVKIQPGMMKISSLSFWGEVRRALSYAYVTLRARNKKNE